MPHPASCAGFVAGAAPEQMLDRQVGHGKAGDREAGAVMGIGPVASTADRSLSIAAKVLNHLCRCPNRLAPLPVIDPAALFPGFEQAGLLHYLPLGSASLNCSRSGSARAMSRAMGPHWTGDIKSMICREGQL